MWICGYVDMQMLVVVLWAIARWCYVGLAYNLLIHMNSITSITIILLSLNSLSNSSLSPSSSPTPSVPSPQQNPLLPPNIQNTVPPQQFQQNQQNNGNGGLYSHIYGVTGEVDGVGNGGSAGSGGSGSFALLAFIDNSKFGNPVTGGIGATGGDAGVIPKTVDRMKPNNTSQSNQTTPTNSTPTPLQQTNSTNSTDSSLTSTNFTDSTTTSSTSTSTSTTTSPQLQSHPQQQPLKIEAFINPDNNIILNHVIEVKKNEDVPAVKITSWIYGFD